MNNSKLETNISNIILLLYSKLFISNNRNKTINNSIFISNFLYRIYKITKFRYFILNNIENSFDNVTEKRDFNLIEKSFIKKLLKNISDLLYTKEIEKSKVLELVKFKNETYLFEAQKYDNGIIFVSAHYGLWELMATSVKIKFNITLSVFAQRPTNKAFEDLFYNYRKRFEIETHYNEGISSLKKVDQKIKNKEYFAFLVDQHGESKNIFINFFNKEVSFPSISINFAYKYNIPIVPVLIHRNKDDIHEIEFFEPIFCNGKEKKEAIQKTAQEIYNIFQRFIIEKPDEWLWTYERFNKLE